jgi:two-component sensor histidine kinase/CHASE2 domain-containing sensor protein
MFPANSPHFMLHRRATLISLLAVLATLLSLALSLSPRSALSRAELAVRDWLANHGRRTSLNPKLIFLAIDSDSVGLEADADLKELFGIEDQTTPEGRALSLMSKGWPWPRSVHALILDRLMAAGANSVVFDLNFPKPSEHDEALRKALERYADRVVIGSNFSDAASAESNGVNAELTLPTTALIPSSKEPDSRVGFVNFWPDSDGVIRQARFQASFAQFLGNAEIPGEPRYSSLAAQAVRKAGHPEKIPADGANRLFRFTAGPGKGFPARSVFEIFVPEYWTRNYQSGAVFAGATVVVGAAGNWQHDEHQTPFGLMAGPEIQLNVINALLHGEFLKSVAWPIGAAVWLLAAVIGAGGAIVCTGPVLRIGVFLAVGLGWAAVQLPLFNHAGLLAPVAGPLAVLGLTGIFSLIYDLVRAGAEQLRLRLTLIERKRAQELLESTNAELERRVAERTAELTKSNATLTSLLHEKDVLLKEVHHRVKNNLQIISSLLNLQSGYIEDPVALNIFNESRNRVRSMALIHEKLYQSKDLAKIDLEDYLKTLTSGLQSSFSGRPAPVRMTLEVEPIMLGVDAAVPCGLIVNELVTNCFKYAFGSNPGEIRISMKRTGESRLQLTVSDDGVGFPKDVDFRNTESLGMQLVTTLTDQLEGTLDLRNGCGTSFEISFPETQRIKT